MLYLLHPINVSVVILLSWCGDHRELHLLTHSYPTRRSSDLFGLSTSALRLRERCEVVQIHGYLVMIGPERAREDRQRAPVERLGLIVLDRKSTRLNSSH